MLLRSWGCSLTFLNEPTFFLLLLITLLPLFFPSTLTISAYLYTLTTRLVWLPRRLVFSPPLIGRPPLLVHDHLFLAMGALWSFLPGYRFFSSSNDTRGHFSRLTSSACPIYCPPLFLIYDTRHYDVGDKGDFCWRSCRCHAFPFLFRSLAPPLSAFFLIRRLDVAASLPSKRTSPFPTLQTAWRRLLAPGATLRDGGSRPSPFLPFDDKGALNEDRRGFPPGSIARFLSPFSGGP